MTTIHY